MFEMLKTRWYIPKKEALVKRVPRAKQSPGKREVRRRILINKNPVDFQQDFLFFRGLFAGRQLDNPKIFPQNKEYMKNSY